MLLTEERLRNDLNPILDALDEEPDSCGEVSLAGFDDLNRKAIEEWLREWKEEMSRNIENCTLEYEVHMGDESLEPCIYVWYEDLKEDQE